MYTTTATATLSAEPSVRMLHTRHPISVLPTVQSSASPHFPAGSSEPRRPAGRLSHAAFLWSLLPPVDVRVVALCAAWYLCSAAGSNLSKSILTAFPFPVAVTEVQFLVCAVCTFALAGFTEHQRPGQSRQPRFRPTKAVLRYTVPMGGFQFAGHIVSHMATALIPVATVHAVKALSPLLTVLCYRLLLGVRHTAPTYLSLIPLTLGVILVCSGDRNLSARHGTGVLYALCGAVIFVSQNIFAKRVLTPQPEAQIPTTRSEAEKAEKLAGSEKPDKVTVLLYCSVIGFCLTLPVFLGTEAFRVAQSEASIPWALCVTNGVAHTAQSLLAFHILGLVSPVAYSVASLMKRIVVIFAAICWNTSSVSGVQACGFLLCFLGLYGYDRWSGRIE